MSKHDEAAAELQRGVKYDELDNLDKGLDDYSETQVRQAIVHTRQDMVLLVSHLSSLNKQAGSIRRLLWIITGLLIWLLLRPSL